MSFLARVKYLPGQVMRGPLLPSPMGRAGMDGNGVFGFAVDKGERIGAAFLYGAAKGYYRDSFVWKGYGLDLWTGAAATLASAFLTAYTGGRSRLAPHLNRIGDAGVMSYFNSMGAAWGGKKAGRQVVVSQAALPGQTPVLGVIQPGVDGAAFLSPEEFAQYSNPR